MMGGMYEKGMEGMKVLVKGLEVLGDLLGGWMEFGWVKDMMNGLKDGV